MVEFHHSCFKRISFCWLLVWTNENLALMFWLVFWSVFEYCLQYNVYYLYFQFIKWVIVLSKHFIWKRLKGICTELWNMFVDWLNATAVHCTYYFCMQLDNIWLHVKYKLDFNGFKICWKLWLWFWAQWSWMFLCNL